MSVNKENLGPFAGSLGVVGDDEKEASSGGGYLAPRTLLPHELDCVYKALEMSFRYIHADPVFSVEDLYENLKLASVNFDWFLRELRVFIPVLDELVDFAEEDEEAEGGEEE